MNFDQLSAFYHQPFFDLISQSRAVHLQRRGEEIQRCIRAGHFFVTGS
jgi:hypothetical protein